jgi:guanylate kinase
MISERKRGSIIIIVAPSGTGKSTLIKRLEHDYASLNWSVSYTTRPKRELEVNGKDYFFIEKEEFLAKKGDGDFIEWAEVHGNYYGTSKSFVETSLDQGQFILFDLDVQGTDNLTDYFGDEAKAIFIAPPSIEALESRLRGRGTEKNATIELRLSNAKSELLRKDDYDYLVVNDDIEKAYLDLKGIFDQLMTAKE